ncbi:uncharacterized protein LOC112690879 [Sipha flava]|uniref:Uncharacterized protein LOC112690879 n=1 Tax=Sipha flava TaxID=143950 RepID=A0A8B8GD77_9HEMI|nr:uncharacterized protein LOC112690879 [Sipha flava]
MNNIHFLSGHHNRLPPCSPRRILSIPHCDCRRYARERDGQLAAREPLLSGSCYIFKSHDTILKFIVYTLIDIYDFNLVLNIVKCRKMSCTGISTTCAKCGIHEVN